MADDPLFIQPKNTMPRIDRVWVFLSVDRGDGNEGVCAAQLGGQWFPLITASPETLKSLEPMAQQIAARTGMTIKLVEFSTRSELYEIKP